jgi:ATP-binding cassette subfamily B protein
MSSKLNLSTITRFSGTYIARHYPKFIILILCEMLAAASSPYISFAIKQIIDTVSAHISNLSFEILYSDLRFLVLILVFSVFTNRISGLTNVFTIPAIRIQIKRDVFAHLQKHSHRFFAENFSGALGHRVSELSNQFSLMFSMMIFHVIPIIISLLTALYLTFKVNVLIFIAVFAWAIIYSSCSFYFGSNIKEKSKIHASRRSEVSGRIIDSITNIFNVRAFANYNFENDFLNKHLNVEKQTYRKMALFTQVNRLFQGISNILLLAGLVFLSVYLLIQKAITLGDFVLIYSLNYTITNSLENISLNILELFEAMGSIKDSLEVINKPYEIIEAGNAIPLKVDQGNIEIKDLHFAYGENIIFKNFNLNILPKQKVGLVGVSGSGKSTLVNLLMRLYDISQGTIKIDNQNIKDVTLESVHQNIALIPQDTILFNRTIYENIAYGNVLATHDEVIAASKKAMCHEFILTLQNGYDTLVGERGIKLSGGQKQRIAIARAFVKGSKIVILDEATSALDSLTEKNISRSLEAIIKNRTVLVIAHRLSTLKLMDRIIVLEKGHIVEDGSHDELLKKNGKYAKMWEMQSA